MKVYAVAILMGLAQAENLLARPKESLVETAEGAEATLLAQQAAEDAKIEKADALLEVENKLASKERQALLEVGVKNPQFAFQMGQKEDLKVASDKCDRFVELLENQGSGAAYTGKMYINGQKLDTVWDTGSDEAVVNSVSTLNMLTPCFDAFGQQAHDCYNKLKSSNYRALRAFPQGISYGSGETFVLPGMDEVNFVDGQCKHSDVGFMELVQTDITQLIGHDIDAIGGLGPKKFEPLTFASQMGVDRFSFCFMSNTSQPGQLVWNDYKAEEHKGFKFNTMPVNGKDYWSVKATDFTVVAPGKDSKKVGCVDKECYCVVDTGTSLITLDKNTLKEVEVMLDDFEKNTGMKCNEDNIKQFPTIKFYLDGHEHLFKPEDYLVYTTVDELPEHVSKALHFTSKMFPWLKEPESKKECVMMFTPPMEDGLCVLGMPFFRNYYVTYDREARTVSTAPHDGECRPAKASFMQQELRPTMKSVDMSKVVFSKAFHKLNKLAGPIEHHFTHVI